MRASLDGRGGNVRNCHWIGKRIDHRFRLARPRLTVGDTRRRVIPRSPGVVKRRIASRRGNLYSFDRGDGRFVSRKHDIDLVIVILNIRVIVAGLRRSQVREANHRDRAARQLVGDAGLGQPTNQTG